MWLLSISASEIMVANAARVRWRLVGRAWVELIFRMEEEGKTETNYKHNCEKHSRAYKLSGNHNPPQLSSNLTMTRLCCIYNWSAKKLFLPQRPHRRGDLLKNLFTSQFQSLLLRVFPRWQRIFVNVSPFLGHGYERSPTRAFCNDPPLSAH